MICMDVDTALVGVPVNVMPLTDDTDFKSREISIAYDATGMDLAWQFITSAGVETFTAVTPTTSGDYDWAHSGDGMYTIEIPASGGASINNNTEGYGRFIGYCDGVLPWVGPWICFRAAAINDAMVDGGDYLDVNTVQLGGTTQTGNDVGADVNAILTDTDTTIPGLIGTAQADLDTITGSDGVTLATAQGNYAPAKAGDNMNLADNAITSAKYDESTAYPLAAASSTLATSSAQTTAQNDLDILTGTDGVTLATSQPNYAPATASALSTAQTDLDTITGSDGVTLATAQGNYAPSKAGDAMALTAGAVDDVWDETKTSHVTADSFGVAIKDILTDTETTIPGTITTMQNDLDILTGTDGVTLATSQPNYAPAVAGDNMNLADNAITAGKYDESTAFPVASADTGATQIARTGADADTLETISDQIDAIGGDATAANQTTIITHLTDIKGATWTSTDTLENIYDDTNELQGNQGNWLTVTGHATAAALTTAQNDLDIITGTSGVLIDDDAITASKYDESTAFPLKSDDSGATQVARVGADGDTLETLSDQLDTAQADLDTITGTDGVTLATTQGNYAPAKAGDAMALTSGAVDDVWDEEITTGHTTADTAGKKLNDAGAAGDPWATDLPGSYTGSNAGKVLADVLVDTGTTIPGTITTVQNDLDIITGTSGVLIDDDAITASKYDESTAFPLKSDDSGATQVARTGADADTLETLSDQLDTAQADLDTITGSDGVTLATAQALYAPSKAGDAMGLTSGAVDDVWDELTSGHVTGGSFAVAVTDILGDTNELQTNQGNWLTVTGHATAAALTTAQNDLDIITGTSGVLLDDNAITSSKYDESTAFPLKSDDSGATQVARVGADGDTLETLSDQLDTAQADLDTITGTDGVTLATAQGNYAPAKAGDAMALTAGAVDDVWDEEITVGHTTADTAGKKLNDASSAGDPWATALPGAYGAGTAGKIIGDNINAPIGTIDTVVDAIKAVTDLLPDAGALTSIAQASALATAQTDLDTITGSDGVTLATAQALYAPAKAGDEMDILSATEDNIADKVWDETLSGHLGAGSTGNALNAAGAAGDPWSTLIPGAYGAGTAGYILGNNINAPLDTIDSNIDAILTDTDVTIPALIATAQADLDIITGAAGVIIDSTQSLDGLLTGTGNTLFRYTITVETSPEPDVTVWVTSDVAGTQIVASGVTNDLGYIDFMLNSGLTYYFWRKKAGITFTDPDTEVIS